MQSFKKKIVSLFNNGIDPLKQGMFNFTNIDLDAELLAEDRTITCISCKSFVDEPIDFLRVTDVNIPMLTNKMCDDCGCTLSYKLRQSITKCKQWKE